MSQTHHGTVRRHHLTSQVGRRSHRASGWEPAPLSAGARDVYGGGIQAQEQMPAGGLAEGAIGRGNIQPLTITETEIDDDSISTPKLQANSVETNNIAAGAVTTEKITLQDEFGATMLTPSGFVGSWEDYMLTGLYNGSFGDSAVANPAALGRTVHVPYWTLSEDTSVGSPFFVSDVGSLQARFDTASDALHLESDLIRVRQGVRMAVFLRGLEASGGPLAEVSVQVEISEYDFTGALSDSYTVGATSFVSADGTRTVVIGSFFPADVYISVGVLVTAVALDSGSAILEIREVGVFLSDEAHGDAFYDAAPPTGTRFHRDDLGMEYFYSGAGWYSSALHALPIPWAKPTSLPYTATITSTERAIIPIPTGQDDVILMDLDVHFHVASGGTALGASHKWRYTIERIDDAGVVTTLATFDIASGASNTWRSEKVVLGVEGNASTASGSIQIQGGWTKTGTPGNLTALVGVSYRYIAS